MNILSIQSHVAYGHVGNASATFPMQRLGVDVWPIHTVQFSNHTGYGNWKGRVFDGGMIDEVMEGIAERGVLGTCDGVISGYMGSADIGHAILSAVEQVRAANPKALYCCDPVIGDVGRGVFVRPGIPEFMREHVVPQATIMSPNLFELDYLTGRTSSTIADVLDAAAALRSRGPRVVLVTSAVGLDADDQVMRMIAQDASQTWQVTTPLIDRKFTGSGDLTTAIFLANLLETGDLGASLSMTASTVYSVLLRTHELGRRELALVQAQDDIVNPRYRFDAVPL